MLEMKRLAMGSLGSEWEQSCCQRGPLDRAWSRRPDGSHEQVWVNLIAPFRRLWASERKGLPVKDVAAAGGWKDITTLLDCYQQPDEDTLREVVEFRRSQARPLGASKHRTGSQKLLTH